MMLQNKGKAFHYQEVSWDVIPQTIFSGASAAGFFRNPIDIY